jgi:hypothetical protein
MQTREALFAILVLAAPSAAIGGVFYNRPDALEHPREAMQKAWLVRVKAGENARFYWNVVKPNCPALTQACRARGYLVPGDLAVASYTTGAFTVVEFNGPGGAKTDGAIESRLLERIEPPKPTPQDWIGHWQDTDEQDIVVSPTDDPSILGFIGNAMWGSHDPRLVKIGAVHLGDFGAYVKPMGEWGGFIADLDDANVPDYRLPPIAEQEGLRTDWAHYFPAEADNAESGRCRGSFRLLGPYLLAYTPLYICGGMNVTFTGVYRRVSPHRR